LAQGRASWRAAISPAKKAKTVGVPMAEVPTKIVTLLKEIQKNLFERAKKYRDANSFEVNSYDEFKQKIEDPGGFLWAHWDGTAETEERIATETKATIRCIPFARAKEEGKCMVTGIRRQGGWCSRRRIDPDPRLAFARRRANAKRGLASVDRRQNLNRHRHRVDAVERQVRGKAFADAGDGKSA